MISQDLKDIIASEQQKGETHNDTLLRLLREHALKKIELQRKVEQLTAQLQQVQPHGGVLA